MTKSFLINLSCAGILALISSAASAELIDRGNGLIYDTVQDLTWTQNAGMSGSINWESAAAWADNLVYGGFDDWRLPTTTQFDDPTCSPDVRNTTQYNLFYEHRLDCTGGEMERLTELYDPWTNPIFYNLGRTRYWTATPYRDGTDPCIYYPDYDVECNLQTQPGAQAGFYWQWGFQGYDGFNGPAYKTTLGGGNSRPAWAVRDGDVTGAPINRPPALSIDAPADGASFVQGESVTFQGSADDDEDGNLSSVIQWQSNIDGNLGSGATVTSTTLAPGTHSITASVTDGGGASDSASIAVTITIAGGGTEIIVDNQDAGTSRTGSWRASSGPDPWAGQSVYNNAGNTFRWYPNIPISNNYQVFAWWTYHPNRSTTVPYTVTYEGGSDTVIVNQRDASLGGKWILLGSYPFIAGNSHYVQVSSENGQASADAVRLLAGEAPANFPPSVSISEPADGTEITEGDALTLEASASDIEDGSLSSSTQWQSSLDGALAGGASILTNSLSVGMHLITVSVTDSGGESASDTITVTVNEAPANFPPSVSISEPADGTEITEGDTLTLEASASDIEDGTLSSSIQWQSSLDGALAGGASILTNSLSVGMHLITASVTDSGGESASDTITVTVNAPGALEVIVDNQDANTIYSGAWRRSSGPNPWAGQSVYNDGGQTFRWLPNLSEPGNYTVYAWWTYHRNRSSNVPYRINHAGGETTVLVNQLDQSLAGKWTLLGTFSFNGDGSGFVEVSSENGQASADAIRLVKN